MRLIVANGKQMNVEISNQKKNFHLVSTFILKLPARINIFITLFNIDVLLFQDLSGIDDLLDDEGWDILNDLTEDELAMLNSDFDPEVGSYYYCIEKLA